MTISKKIRIAIVLSGIWSIIALCVAIDSASTNWWRFHFTEFFMVLTVGAILPLLIVWGIIWICSASKEEKTENQKTEQVKKTDAGDAI